MVNHAEVPVNDFFIPSGYVGNADPNAGSLWMSKFNAPPPMPGPPQYQPRDQYGNPLTITNRIQGFVNGFGVPGRNTTPGYVPSMNWNGAGRPVGSTVAAPRSAEVQTGVAQAYKTNAATNDTARKSLTDWTREFLASRPRAQQYADEETGAIGRLYGSGSDSTGGALERIRRNARLALRDQTEAAYRRAGRTNSLRRLGAGGVNSSYLDRAYAQDMGRIASEGALRDADRERSDLMYLEDRRLGQVGNRQQLMDRLLERNLLPVSVASGVQGDEVNRLGQIAGLDYGNNDYIPAEDAYARRINFMNDLIARGYEV